MNNDVAFLARFSVLMLIAWAASVWVMAIKRGCSVELAVSSDWPNSMTIIELQALLTQWKDAFSAAQATVTMLAIIIGGIVAYIKLVKGRLFSKRLEPLIQGDILYSDGYACVKVVVCLKNVGLTRVDIDLESSTLQLETYAENDYQPDFHKVPWTRLGTVEALLYHDWVEPGEAVPEERLLALPRQRPIAVNLKLRILPKPTRLHLRKRTEWNALAVATLAEVQTAGVGRFPEAVPVKGG